MMSWEDLRRMLADAGSKTRMADLDKSLEGQSAEQLKAGLRQYYEQMKEGILKTAAAVAELERRGHDVSRMPFVQTYLELARGRISEDEAFEKIVEGMAKLAPSHNTN